MNIFEIAGIKLSSVYVQAPLAGYTSYAMRSLAADNGCSLTYTEMISCNALVYESKKTKLMLPLHKEKVPVALQLFGGDKETVLQAIKIVEKEAYYDFLDFNIGCPVPKVYKQGAGSSWLNREDELIDLLEAMCKISSKPVIVKIRLGIDMNHLNYLSLVKRIEQAGVKAIAVHGRTRKEMFSGPVHYDMIREIKEAVNIPIIANGDISLDNIDEVKEITHADAYMIGRNAIGNPEMFKNLILKEEGKEIEQRSFSKQKMYILKHLSLLIEEMQSEKMACEVMRGIACFYLKGLDNMKQIKIKLVKCSSYQEYVDALEIY